MSHSPGNASENKAKAIIDLAMRDAAPVFDHLDEIERVATRKVLDAFQAEHVAARHFAGSTGYGYSDIGRDTLERVFARAMDAPAALVRPMIASGTHALTLCLFGLLRPGDTLLSAAGKPYDTLEQVIGIRDIPGEGSLKEWGVGYRQVELLPGGAPDIDAIVSAMDERVRVVWVQRSRGYDWRPSLSIEELKAIAQAVHAKSPDCVVAVDNCYGEFTGGLEPCGVGADIAAGSLIKNPGGGIAPTGGYIVGRQDLIEKIACRLTAPGIAGEVGSYAPGYLPYFQGLFMAPHVVNQALKVAVLAARALTSLGYDVHPAYDAPRADIIQAVRFGAPEPLIVFCQAIQAASPVDSEASPEPWDMPGYEHPVIMAAGTFVSGSSIELSADAPITPPYIGYLQGGLTLTHGRIALESAVKSLLDR